MAEATVKRRKQPTTRTGARPRSIRVDDRTWNYAREVAAQNGTSVSEIVVTYLKKPVGLSRAQAASLVKAQHPRHGANGSKDQNAGARDPQGHFIRPAVAPRGERVDQKTCPHPSIKTLGAADFCRRCGINMDLVK
jgi:hypothetical protein